MYMTVYSSYLILKIFSEYRTLKDSIAKVKNNIISDENLFVYLFKVINQHIQEP